MEIGDFPPDADLFADAVAQRVAEILVGRLPAPPPDPLLTQAQVAAWLSISERSLDSLVTACEIIPVRVTPGKRGRRFTRASIEAYIRSRAVR